MGNNLITSFLEEISKRYIGVRFSYLQNPSESSHFISVSNNVLYESDEFADLEFEFRDRFYDKFPFENLTFLIDDELRLFTSLKITREFFVPEKLWFDKDKSDANFELNYLTNLDQYESEIIYCLAA